RQMELPFQNRRRCDQHCPRSPGYVADQPAKSDLRPLASTPAPPSLRRKILAASLDHHAELEVAAARIVRIDHDVVIAGAEIVQYQCRGVVVQGGIHIVGATKRLRATTCR